MKKTLYTFTIIALSLVSWRSSAQERQDNAWKALFTDYSLNSSTTLRLETHVRTRQFFVENDQYLLRPSVSFKLGNNTAFATGYTLISSNTPQHRTIENNLWQQGSLGVPGQLDHPKVIEASKKVIKACEKFGKSCGTQLNDPNPENIQSLFDIGYTYAILGSDLFVLWKWAEQMQQIIKSMR